MFSELNEIVQKWKKDDYSHYPRYVKYVIIVVKTVLMFYDLLKRYKGYNGIH